MQPCPSKSVFHWVPSVWGPLVRPIAIACAVVSFGGACVSTHSTGAVSPSLENATLEPISIADEQFSAEVFELLQHGKPTAARLSRLVAVVHHQLGAAAALFERGENATGLRAVEGALLLVRVGELRPEMFEGRLSVLERAASLVAQQGDEGRALGLYNLLVNLAPKDSVTRREAELHLNALRGWQETTQPADNMIGMSDRRLAAAHRLMVEPNEDNLTTAVALTHQWVELGLVEQRKEGAPTSYDEHDERMEASRALMGGAQNMVALYLRNGDARQARASLEQELMAAVSGGHFADLLSEAADGRTQAWGELFQLYAFSRGQIPLVEAETAAAAAWGAAVELYRSRPNQFDAALPLANLLMTHQLGAVTPLVLRKGLAGVKDPKAVAAGLRLSAQGILDAERSGQLDQARRIYDNTRPLLQQAVELKEPVEPSPAQIEYLIGAMESRAAELDRARVHLRESARLEPTRGALRLLAAIERQQGNLPEALISVRSMKELAEASQDLHGQARALLLEHAIVEEMGEQVQAQAILDEALRRALETRTSAHTMEEVTYAESTLAEVLEGYRELAAANRAADRAHEAALREPGQLAMTLQDASRRAIMVGDVESARVALRRAVDGRVEPDVLLYIALWTWLSELRSGGKPGWLVTAAISQVDSKDAWIQALQHWAKGEIDDKQLQASAVTPVQKVEAEFYIAAKPYVTTPTPEARAALQAVATSEAIELVEVRVARALLQDKKSPHFELPKDVALP